MFLKKLVFLVLFCTQAMGATNFDSYSVNLLWVNAVHTNETVFPRDSLSQVVNWSRLHPQNQINLWYDNTTEAAVENTHTLIAENELHNVKLCNINTLLRLQNAYEILNQSCAGLYFRVDFFKLLITSELLLTKPHELMVFSDFDLEPLTHENLFDAKTRDNIEKFNLVFCAKGFNGFENSFHIMKHDSMLLECLGDVEDELFTYVELMTDYNQCTYGLNCAYLSNTSDKKVRIFNLFSPQRVYDIFSSSFFKLYYARKGWLIDDETGEVVRSELQRLDTNKMPSERVIDLSLLNSKKYTMTHDLHFSNESKIEQCELSEYLEKKIYINKGDDFVYKVRYVKMLKDEVFINSFYLGEKPVGGDENIPVLQANEMLTVIRTTFDNLIIPGKVINHTPGHNYNLWFYPAPI